MDIHLPADQQSIIESLVASGRYSSASEVIVAGVQILAASERLREEVQLGIKQADRGEVVEHETVFARLRALASAGQRAIDE
jgi:antitoxin ParD1/3/4